MQKRAVMMVAAVGAVSALCGVASGDIFTWTFGLDGSQEVPPVNTPGTGTATVTLDSDTGLVTVEGTYMDLLANANAAHIHGLADFGENADVIVPLIVSGGTTGTVTGSGTLSPDLVAGMIDGLTYVNVHTDMFPGGEIRGQIVPAPAGLALFGIGVLAARRRRM